MSRICHVIIVVKTNSSLCEICREHSGRRNERGVVRGGEKERCLRDWWYDTGEKRR